MLLWKAWSYGRFTFDGLHPSELPNGVSSVTVTFADEQQTRREYTLGDAALFSETSRLPNLAQVSQNIEATESLEHVFLEAEATVEHDGRGFHIYIAATFDYDPKPSGYETHPYGFRFTAARLTTTHTSAASTTEYTDVYELLDAILTVLYAPAVEPE